MVTVSEQRHSARDTAASWSTNNPVLGPAELAYETDTGRFKFGDGAAPYNSLPYAERFIQQYALSDQANDLTVGTKLTVRLPVAIVLSEVRISVSVAPAGSALTVDINENGISILSTKLTIDPGEKTSTTAAVPAVIFDPNLADDSEITFDVDAIGGTTAGRGLIATLIGAEK